MIITPIESSTFHSIVLASCDSRTDMEMDLLSTWLKPKGLLPNALVRWCFLLLALSLPVRLQKEPLCPGGPVFGKGVWAHLIHNSVDFSTSGESSLLLQWQTLGKAAWIQISTLLHMWEVCKRSSETQGHLTSGASISLFALWRLYKAPGLLLDPCQVLPTWNHHKTYRQNLTLSLPNSYYCLVDKSFPTLWCPGICNLTVSSVCGISQARILEWVAISFSRGIFLTQRSDSYLLHCRWVLYHWDTREAHLTHITKCQFHSFITSKTLESSCLTPLSPALPLQPHQPAPTFLPFPSIHLEHFPPDT